MSDRVGLGNHGSLKTLTCETLYAKTLGSEDQPIQTIHRASTDVYQNDLTYRERLTNDARMRLTLDGHLQIVQDLE
eukprot:2460996-Pleurochrysis_carterae.AAC.1